MSGWGLRLPKTRLLTLWKIVERAIEGHHVLQPMDVAVFCQFIINLYSPRCSRRTTRVRGKGKSTGINDTLIDPSARGPWGGVDAPRFYCPHPP